MKERFNVRLVSLISCCIAFDVSQSLETLRKYAKDTALSCKTVSLIRDLHKKGSPRISTAALLSSTPKYGRALSFSWYRHLGNQGVILVFDISFSLFRAFFSIFFFESSWSFVFLGFLTGLELT